MIKIIDINFQGFKSAVACFLIKSEANLILVETGPSNSYSQIEKKILELGEDINKIKHVFVTHIHLDHSGGAWRFAKNGANIYVHPKGATHLENPEKLIASATRIYGDKMDKLWGKVEKIDSKRIYRVKDNEFIKQKINELIINETVEIVDNIKATSFNREILSINKLNF